MLKPPGARGGGGASGGAPKLSFFTGPPGKGKGGGGAPPPKLDFFTGPPAGQKSGGGFQAAIGKGVGAGANTGAGAGAGGSDASVTGEEGAMYDDTFGWSTELGLADTEYPATPYITLDLHQVQSPASP